MRTTIDKLLPAMMVAVVVQQRSVCLVFGRV